MRAYTDGEPPVPRRVRVRLAFFQHWDLLNHRSLAPLWRHPSEPVLEIPGILRVALFVIFSGGGGSDGLCLVGNS